MAHEKNHDYHILNPSIWPFLSAVGAFILLLGCVLFFHNYTSIVFFTGLLLVIYCMYGWWSDVVTESHIGDHTPVVKIALKYGVIMFIVSEVMFFSAWFWSFFKHALYPMEAIGSTWPPAGIETFDPWHLPLINTLILLCSGAAATWAHHAIAHENNRKKANKNFKANDFLKFSPLGNQPYFLLLWLMMKVYSVNLKLLRIFFGLLLLCFVLVLKMLSSLMPMISIFDLILIY